MRPSGRNKRSVLHTPTELMAHGRSMAVAFIVPLIVSIIVVMVVVLFLLNAFIDNGAFCFPLDDSWIHLTFAKNLSAQFRFCYVKDGPSIQASTSPLFAFLLTPAFMFRFNEFFVSYFWGVCGVIALVWAFNFCLTRIMPDLPEWTFWASGAILIAVALDRRLLWVSLSGMETTCFIAIIFTARALMTERKYSVHAFSLALLSCWLRPEGTIFAVIVAMAIVLDYLSWRTPKRIGEQTLSATDTLSSYVQVSRRAFIVILLCGVLGLLGYWTLNMLYNGSPWPSTMAAKVTGFRKMSNPDYFLQVLNYLCHAGLILLIPGFVWAVIETVLGYWRRQAGPVLIDILWCGTLIALYYWKLPSVRQHGRYILPVLPFLIMAGVYGSSSLIARFSGKNTKRGAIMLHGLLVLVMLWQVSKIHDGMLIYSEQCRYYLERHVAAAEWIKTETPPDAIIATHDIGALGFLAERKLIDMAGLVDPEIVPHLSDNTFMKQWLLKRRADYVAILNTWYTVINVNPLAIFAPGPGEALSIFPLTPHLKFMQQDLINLYFEASALTQQRDLESALKVLDRLLFFEPQFAAGHTLKAKTLIALERFNEAEKSLEQALRYQPDSAEAHYQFAAIDYQRGNVLSAAEHLNKVLGIDPNHSNALTLARKIKEHF